MPTKTLETLVTAAELVEIVAFELSVKRAELISNEPIIVPEQVQVQPSYNLTTLTKPDASGFLIRLAVEVHLPTGEIRCEVGAAYNLKTQLDFELSAPVLIEYANEVAVMTLLPYVRQHIADLSQRALGFPLLMPVMPRGTLQFNQN
jgi:hypothetical protein